MAERLIQIVSTSVNGAVPPTQPVSEKPAEVKHSEVPVEKPSEEKPAATDPDTEMQDADAEKQPEAEPSSSTAPAAEANGTPSSKSKRKSSAGIPEHRSKTLKKKQSKAKITHLDAKPGDLYLARLRSYPPWPAIVCDEAILPQVLLATRPVTAMKTDGTYNEPYADDGKKVADRTFAVMFLHTNEL